MQDAAFSQGITAPIAAGSTARWQPGSIHPRHNEVFASGREASGAGAALAFALDGLRTDEGRDVLWVQDRASLKLTGRPYRPGLPESLRARLIHVVAEKCEDALFALEEGLRCRDLACVIGEITGNPKAFDFTASRRLSLAAEKYRVPLYLVRIDAARDLSSARMRWDVRAAPSPRPRWNGDAPGFPSWRAELFRARAHPPGQWILHDDGTRLVAGQSSGQSSRAPDHGDLAAAAGARSLASH